MKPARRTAAVFAAAVSLITAVALVGPADAAPTKCQSYRCQVIQTTTPTTTSPATTTASPAPVAGTVTASTTANGSRMWLASRYWTAQSPGRSYSLRVDPDPMPNYVRTELRDGDRWTAGDGRSRVELNSAPTALPWGTDVWESYSFRQTGTLPTTWTIINQFHQRPEPAESIGKPPCFTVQFRDGRLHLATRGDAAVTSTSQPPATDRYSGVWNADGQWHHLVLRFRFHWSQGQLQAWLDGRQIVNVTGIPLGYNDVNGPSPKIGQYRASSSRTTVVEFADYELGTASLSDRIAHPLPTP